MKENKSVVHHNSCSLCITSFKDKKNLKEPIAAVHENPHKCDICGKSFIHIGFLNQHILKMHEGIEAIIDNNQITFQCSICCSIFAHKHLLEQHVSTVHEGHKHQTLQV